MSLGGNVLKLTASRVASSVVLFATMPIVTRMFMPADFGVQQVFIAIMGVLGIIACFRYELSIPMGRDDKEASASFALSAMISLIFALALLAIVPFVKTKLAVWFKSPDLERFLWLLPVAILMESLRRSLRYWAAYRMRFGIMAWEGLAKASVAGLTPIVWYSVWGRSPAGLLVSIFTGGAVAILVLSIPLFRVLARCINDSSFRSIAGVAKYYKRFPIYDTWSGLINALSAQMPTFLLGLLFPTKIVGYYSIGNRVITLPASVLGDSIKQVFFPTASKEQHKTGDISGIVRNIVTRLVQIGVFPMLAIGFSGVKLFGFIFGQEWVEAGVYAQILSIAFLSQFVTSPITAVFSIRGYQGKRLIYSTVLASSRFMALILAGQMNNPRVVLGAYAIASSTVYLLTFAWLLRLSDVPVLWGAKIMLRHIFVSAALLLPTLLFVYRGYNIWIILASLLSAAVFYLLILYKVDVTLRSGVDALFQKARTSIRANGA